MSKADAMENGSLDKKSLSVMPLTPEEPSNNSRCRRCNLKVIVVACVLLLVVCAVVGCCVYVFGILRPWQPNSDDQQEYVVEVKDVNGNPYYVTIDVGVAKGEEVFGNGYSDTNNNAKTVDDDDDEGGDESFLVRDVNKKLDATVSEGDAACFLSPYDANDEVSPVELNDFLSSYSADTDFSDEVTTYEMYVADDPIEDVTAESDVIGHHCADKTSYWVITGNATTTCGGQPCEEDNNGDEDEESSALVQQKGRGGRLVLRRTCDRVCQVVLKTVCKVFRRFRIIRRICECVAKRVCNRVCY